ncbi:MAG: Fur family transcriptional regulator [Gaiellaceae bacterium]
MGELESWTSDAVARLQAQGYRNGAARRAVVELLGRQNCCLTAQEIFDELRGGGRPVGLASVYRVVDELTDQGLLQRIDLGAGTARYEPLLPTGEHHHHLVCDDCGKVEAFEDDELELALTNLERRSGYSVAGHEVVLRGACADCRTA